MRLLILVVLLAGCRSPDVSANMVLRPDGNTIEVENAHITIEWRGGR